MGAGSDGQLIHIWVDDREARGSGLVARLAEMEGVSVTVKRLRTGDYLIEGKAVLERKRVPDFLGSLFEGRLFAQPSGWRIRPYDPSSSWRGQLQSGPIAASSGNLFRGRC
jgi:hypothetical protein